MTRGFRGCERRPSTCLLCFRMVSVGEGWEAGVCVLSLSPLLQNIKMPLVIRSSMRIRRIIFLGLSLYLTRGAWSVFIMEVTDVGGLLCERWENISVGMFIFVIQLQKYKKTGYFSYGFIKFADSLECGRPVAGTAYVFVPGPSG